jgi:GT2 family glycosyltransferase
MVAEQFPHFTLLRETENLGFAEACNRGIAASHGPWVAMLNNDAVADPRWASELAAAAAAAPAECGMLQSLMLYLDRPSTINSTGIELAFSGGGRDRNEGEPYVAEASSTPQDIFCPSGGACAYRRSMLDAIRLPTGYFDRSHFMYYEDMDLGWRARLAGFSALYVPRAVVHHRWHGSTKRRGRAWLVNLANTNRIRTLLKNASWSFVLATLPRTLKELGELLWFTRLKAVPTLFVAVGESLRSRRLVAAMLKTARRDVEQKYRAAPR